jgi:transposase
MSKTKTRKRSTKTGRFKSTKIKRAVKHILREFKLDLREGVHTVGRTCVSVAKEIGPEMGKVGKAARNGFNLGIEMVKGAYNGAANVADSTKRK